MFDGAAYPHKLSRPIPLDPISHGNEGLFYYRKALSMEIFRQTDLGQEAIRLTAGDGGPSTVKHIQTLKVVSYKWLGYDKKCRN